MPGHIMNISWLSAWLTWPSSFVFQTCFSRSRSSSCLCPWQSLNFGEPGGLYFHVGASKPNSTAFRDSHWRWWPFRRSGMGSGSAWSHAQQVGDAGKHGKSMIFWERFWKTLKRSQSLQLERNSWRESWILPLSYCPTIPSRKRNLGSQGHRSADLSIDEDAKLLKDPKISHKLSPALQFSFLWRNKDAFRY